MTELKNTKSGDTYRIDTIHATEVESDESVELTADDLDSDEWVVVEEHETEPSTDGGKRQPRPVSEDWDWGQ